jgi:prevent-host-death family protein
MESVGVRELRDHLSRHLAEVQDGQSLTITDRGKPIARLVPVGPSTLDRLIAEGRVTPPKRPKRPKRPARRPIKANGAVSDFVDEQRR